MGSKRTDTNVVPLPTGFDPRGSAAQRNQAQANRRHRGSLPSDSRAPAGRTGAVVHAIEQHRGAAISAGDKDSPPNELGRRVSEVTGFLHRRLTGDYTVDEFGFDPHLTQALLMPLLRPLFSSWFRVKTSGIENLPDTGAALVVANHAGVLPFDGLMASVAVRDEHPRRRHLRLLDADMVFGAPFLGQLARKAGHTIACPADAHRLLDSGELTAVFPEGYKGLGKPFRDRYRLRRFGRGGFVAAALRTKAPIIPCSIVGSEELYPMIANAKPLARLLGLPYFPITPLFPLAGLAGLLPLPSKWCIEFGAPISTADYNGSAADDAALIVELTNQVRETIQKTLYQLLAGRRNAFLGGPAPVTNDTMI